MKLSAIDEYSTFLYHQGTNYASYRLFGAHFTVLRRKPCVRFAVWAPHAQQVSVVGDFNHWDADANPMDIVAEAIATTVSVRASGVPIPWSGAAAATAFGLRILPASRKGTSTSTPSRRRQANAS